MAVAGWCSECNANVWVAPGGGCSNGHPRSSLRGLYESSPDATSSVPRQTTVATSQVPTTGSATASILAVASGQKIIIYAVGLNLIAAVLRSMAPIFLLLAFAASVFAMVGVYRLASALGYSVVSRVVCVLLMFVPLVNLLIMLILVDRATKLLRAAGYKVGLLGARL